MSRGAENLATPSGATPQAKRYSASAARPSQRKAGNSPKCFPHIDIYRVLPEMVWCGFGVLVMLMQPFVRSRTFFYVSCAGRHAGGKRLHPGRGNACGAGFAGWCSPIPLVFFFRLLVARWLSGRAGSGAITRTGTAPSPNFSAAAFCHGGHGSVLASAQELLTAFHRFGDEFDLSYHPRGYRRDSLKSTESAMKYFLLGSFATAFFSTGSALGIRLERNDDADQNGIRGAPP